MRVPAALVVVVLGVAGCGEATVTGRGGDAGTVRDGAAGDDAGIEPDGAAGDPDAAALDAGRACEEVVTRDAPATTDHTFRHHRPHYGARAEGHASCSYYWSDVLPDFTYASSWGTGCHADRYFLLESSITSRAGWAEAVEAAFANWDIPTACTPHWVRTTDAARAHVIIRASDTSRCAGPGTGWYACAWSSWSITLNTAQSWGIGVAGRLDVESLVTVELAHVLHFAHSPDPRDSVSLANVGHWASASMSVPSANSCGFTAYRTCVPGDGCAYESCPPVADGGCGNFRTLRPGDFALAEHLAGRNDAPPHAYDDGSVPPDAMHHDLAMLYGGPATSTSTLFSWTGAAGAFGIRAEDARWRALGFPLDRVGPRLAAADFDGDGHDDLATAMPRCDGGARVHLWSSTGTAFAYGGDAGALDLDDLDLAGVAGRFAAGDVDGDGAGDLAFLEQRAGGAAIRIVRGSPGGGLGDAGAWWTVERGYDLEQVGDRFVAGDFDGDGDDDLAAAYQYPDGTFHAHVWVSDGAALAYAGPDGWLISGTFPLANVQGRMVAGDFDRDGRDDVAMFYGAGGAATLHAWIASGTSFVHQSGPWTVDSGYTLDHVGDRMVAADFDRDGRDDVATAYQYADGTFRFHVWRATGSGFAYDGAGGWYQSGSFDLNNVGGRLVAGRFD